MNWRPMWIPDRMLLVSEGERMPPWYYGAGYRDLSRRVTAFYPIPVNYLVRVKFWLAWKWNSKRATCGLWMPRSEYQPAIDNAYQRGKFRGDLAGYERGYQDALGELMRLAGLTEDDVSELVQKDTERIRAEMEGTYGV